MSDEFEVTNGVEDDKAPAARGAISSHDSDGLAEDPIADAAVNAVSRHDVHFDAEPLR
jgi:hypothetical protein